MAQAPAPKLKRYIGLWMRMASNHVSHSFVRHLTTKKVTVAEWVLLRALHEREPTPPSHLADELGMTRGAITKLANRLIAKSMLKRVSNDSDGRAQTLELTAASKRLLPEIFKLADQTDADFFGCLTAEDRKSLERILVKLVEHHQITDIPKT